MNIPTEAVEAAYDKSLHIAISTAEIEAILEAAAPFMYRDWLNTTQGEK